jgi:hypothetical protein
LWYQVGAQVDVGGELAIPIGFHDWDDTRVNDYTGVDIDILLGVRISGSRR